MMLPFTAATQSNARKRAEAMLCFKSKKRKQLENKLKQYITYENTTEMKKFQNTPEITSFKRIK